MWNRKAYLSQKIEDISEKHAKEWANKVCVLLFLFCFVF